MTSKRLIVIAVVSIILWISCSSEKNNIFQLDNIEKTTVTIDSQKDTVLRTTKGALIKIPAGALSSKQGNLIQLDIKEAYSTLDILKAGLQTLADGEPLSSGGMIYLNAAAGQQITIHSKIDIAIPTPFVNTDMKLYKGVEQMALLTGQHHHRWKKMNRVKVSIEEKPSFRINAPHATESEKHWQPQTLHTLLRDFHQAMKEIISITIIGSLATHLIIQENTIGITFLHLKYINVISQGLGKSSAPLQNIQKYPQKTILIYSGIYKMKAIGCNIGYQCKQPLSHV